MDVTKETVIAGPESNNHQPQKEICDFVTSLYLFSRIN